MTAKTAVTALVLALATFWVAAQQRAPGKTPSAAHAISPEQARTAHDDLQKMRNLVRQMQMNLVLLPPGPTPLRHQFELEIEMWQTLIAHMERQLQSTNSQAPSQR